MIQWAAVAAQVRRKVSRVYTLIPPPVGRRFLFQKKASTAHASRVGKPGFKVKIGPPKKRKRRSRYLSPEQLRRKKRARERRESSQLRETGSAHQTRSKTNVEPIEQIVVSELEGVAGLSDSDVVASGLTEAEVYKALRTVSLSGVIDYDSESSSEELESGSSFCLDISQGIIDQL